MSLLIIGIIESMAYPIFLINMRRNLFHISLRIFFFKGINVRICPFRGRKVNDQCSILNITKLLLFGPRSREIDSSL